MEGGRLGAFAGGGKGTRYCTAVGLLIFGVSVFFLFRSGLFGEGVAFGFQ